MSVIYRTGQTFGMHHVIAVLRGLNHQKIRQYGHDQLSVYGIGKEQSQDYWVSVIRQLIHLGLIKQNIVNNSALQLTEEARPVLRSEVKLFARLRFLRKQIADKENIPPYVVFNDATLEEMAQFTPTTKAEMLDINGVGERKLERFGDAFMNLIQSHLATRR